MHKKSFILTTLLPVLLFCVLPVPAQAMALAVKGEVPNLPPVQPKPQGTLPNYQNSVNTPPEASAPVQETSQPVEENKQDSSSSDAQSRNSGNGVAGVVAIIFSVAAVVGGVLFLLRSDKSQAKD